jgi:hypothetical protein
VVPRLLGDPVDQPRIAEYETHAVAPPRPSMPVRVASLGRGPVVVAGRTGRPYRSPSRSEGRGW